MKRVLSAIAALLMATGVSAGGGNSSLGFAQDNLLKIIKPAVNEGGWKIPGGRESNNQSSEAIAERVWTVFCASSCNSVYTDAEVHHHNPALSIEGRPDAHRC
jgi:hypothetical protein